MKCLGNDILQAYIDCELDIEMKKDVENHLLICEKCNMTYKELKTTDDFVFGKMSNYKQLIDANANPKEERLKPTNRNWDTLKGVPLIMNMLSNYKKIVASACALVLVTTCLTVQPIRAAISDALSIFRVEEVKGIKISMEEIQQIQDKLKGKSGEFNMDSIGKVKTSGKERKPISPDELKNITDFPVLIPDAMQDYTAQAYNIEPGTMEFTLNVQNANSILQSFGAQKLLPESIDGKTFAINFSRTVNVTYSSIDKRYTITQTKSPEIVVPEGVDVDEIYNSVIELPILPQDVQRQLKSIKDWKSTLLIPVVGAETKEIDINGNTGYIYSTHDAHRDTTQSGLIWVNNGVIYTIVSNTTSSDLIDLAKSMR